MVYFFILISIALIATTFWAHYFVFRTLTLFLNITNRTYLHALEFLFVFSPLSFIFSSALIYRFANFWTHFYYMVASVWAGLILYFFLACALIYPILSISKLFSWAVNAKILTIALLLAALAVSVYGLTQAQNIKIKRLELTLPGLPEYWRGKTAVWISDLHLGAIENYEFSARVAKIVKDLRPDLLFIGGDFYDGQTPVDLKKLAEDYGRLNVPSGKFFITGNHEEFGNNEKFISAIAGAGLTYLNNQLIDLNGLQIIGVDYRAAYEREKFAAILDGLPIDKNKPSLLLRHVPDKIDVAAARGISLVLCGHAHRGQLFPIEAIEYLLYKGYQYGLKKFGQTLVYTSSGTGTWGPPMRVLANPEIVEIKFR